MGFPSSRNPLHHPRLPVVPRRRILSCDAHLCHHPLPAVYGCEQAKESQRVADREKPAIVCDGACALQQGRSRADEPLNWSPWFQACRQAIQRGEIGEFSSMVANYGGACRLGTATLWRCFACLRVRRRSGFSGIWTATRRRERQRPERDGDDLLRKWHARFYRYGGWLNIDFVGSDGWISARNEHADFEMWSRLPVTIEPVRRQLPNPKRPRSSQQAVIEGLVNNLDEGRCRCVRANTGARRWRSPLG